jgi:hypothetical protein
MTFKSPPPQRNFETLNLPIVLEISSAFQLWYQYFPHMPKLLKHSLGEKITQLFTKQTELILITGYANKTKKLEVIKQASLNLDLLNFFLQMAFELKAIDNKQIANLSITLNKVGNMIGGWQKQLAEQTPSPLFGEGV